MWLVAPTRPSKLFIYPIASTVKSLDFKAPLSSLPIVDVCLHLFLLSLEFFLVYRHERTQNIFDTHSLTFHSAHEKHCASFLKTFSSCGKGYSCPPPFAKEPQHLNTYAAY